MKAAQSETPPEARTILISVESRKGGVGKTTVALNLASELVFERDYEALVIDLDLAGTNIADEVMSSRVWSTKADLVKGPNGVPTELFEMYRQRSCKTADVESEASQGANAPAHDLEFTPRRINVLGSALAGSVSGEDPFASDRNPSVLFDQVHALYMLDVVKDIVKYFETWVKTEPGRKGVVVFDNAPGYAGLQPWLHDWLTDEGPQVGKVVFVCSVDAQDVISCGYAARDVVDLAKHKQDIARKFWELRQRELPRQNDVAISNSEKRFFCRLVMTMAERDSIGEKSDDLRAFLDGKPASGPLDPRSYVALVINKVPIDALGRGTTVNLKRIFEKKAKEMAERGANAAELKILSSTRELVIEQLLGARGVRGSAIGADDEIALQFCGEYIEREALADGEQDVHAQQRIAELKREINKLERVDWHGDWRVWRHVYRVCSAATEKGTEAFSRASGQRSDFLELGGYTPQYLDKLGRNVRNALGAMPATGNPGGATYESEEADTVCAKALKAAVAAIAAKHGRAHAPSMLDELTAVCAAAINCVLSATVHACES